MNVCLIFGRRVMIAQDLVAKVHGCNNCEASITAEGI